MHMRQPGIEGDAPSLHVGFVDDDQAAFKSEGDALDESTPGLSEVLIHTAKVTQLVRLSREQYVQEQTADQLSLSVSRAVVRRSDAAFLAEEAPTPPAVAPVAGLLNVENVIEGDPVANNLHA